MGKNNKIRIVPIRFSEDEYIKLLDNSSNYNSVSNFVRSRLFNNYSTDINPKELIRSLDKINNNINKIGSNINQIARYTNILLRQESVDYTVINNYNCLLNDLTLSLKELSELYKKLISKNI